MKLYAFPVAPNPTKVKTYLGEKGLQIEIVLVNLREGEQRKPEFLALNPLGKLPVLELDDGSSLTESLAIIQYLEELHPDPTMIGRDPLERARVRELERICDIGVLQSVARTVHATRSPLGLPPRPELAEVALDYLNQHLAVLDPRLGEGPFVAGEHVSIADCTLWAACNFAQFGKVEIDPKYSNVIAWRERFAGRPSTKW